MSSRTASTAVDRKHAPGRFQITHPFHPYKGGEFDLVAWRHNWTEDRIYFQDDDGKLRSVPSQWTNLGSDDPVVVVGAGRAHFRAADLLELADLLKELRS
jgi:hypothetical protein